MAKKGFSSLLIKLIFCFIVINLFLNSNAFSSSLDSRIKNSLDVLKELRYVSDAGIPDDLLARCHAIAIFPSVYKAGFIIGGSYGKGLVMVKSDKKVGWNGPVFFTIGSGSLGWQIGVEATDLILVIMNKRGIDSLTKENFVLGGDMSVAAGPIGRKLRAGTDITISAEIYSYSRTKGLFAGISLDGSYIHHDIDADELFYGKPYTIYEILYGNLPIQPKAQELINYLNSCCGIKYEGNPHSSNDNLRTN